jgi:hypothetical protein
MSLSADEVWRKLADFGGVHRFHPVVDTVDLLSENNEGVGAKRRCNFYDGKSVIETVTEWDPGHRQVVALSDFSMPLKSGTAELSVRRLGPSECEARIAMTVVPKFGPFGWLMGQMMMKPMMRSMLRSVLRGLDHHTRTGDLIGKGGTRVASPDGGLQGSAARS